MPQFRNYSSERTSYEVGNALKIPFEDHTIDTVISFETIEHFKEHEQFIGEVIRVLKNDGIFIISIPNSYVYEPGNTWREKEFNLDKFQEFIKRYSKEIIWFYQQSVVSNYIASQKNLRESIDNQNTEIKSFSLTERKSQKHESIIGVCSNRKIQDDIQELNVTNNDIELAQYRNS